MTTILLEETVPEKNLFKVRKYKAFLSPQEHNRILDEIFPYPIPKNTNVEIKVEVIVKEYKEPEKLDKNKEYNGVG